MTQEEILEAIKITFDQVDLTAKNFDPFALFSALTPDDDITALRRWTIGRGLKASTFDAAYFGWRVQTELGRVPKTAKHFVELYTTSRDITARYNSRLDSPRASIAELSLNTGQLQADLRLYRSDNKLSFSNGDIDDATGSWLRDWKNARRAQVWNKIFCDTLPNADTEWLRFVNALVDTDKTSARYAMAAYKSVMWQVKRKMANEKVYRHLMVITYGGQGSGKSEATRQMAGVMSDLMTSVNFRTITDTKNMELWSYPLVFCDEMEKASGQDVESIKNAITKEENTDRGHSSHNMMTVENGATFIGCCNSTLGERIHDPSGMRRFAPVAAREEPSEENIRAGLPVTDWETINAIDYALLWQSVDHRAEHPLEADCVAMTEWRGLVEAERAQDGVETWLKQLEPDYSLAADGKHREKDFYPLYSQFCADNGYKPCAGNQLSKKMKNHVSRDWYPFKPSRPLNGNQVHEFKDAVRQDFERQSAGARQSLGVTRLALIERASKRLGGA